MRTKEVGVHIFLVVCLLKKMEVVAKSNSKRMYSWWWDSHNTPKNSKWLQDNLAGTFLVKGKPII